MRIAVVVALLFTTSLLAQPARSGISPTGRGTSGSSGVAVMDTRLTTILVPTIYNGPGALGSVWWSSVNVSNFSTKAFSTPGVTFAVGCDFPACLEERALRPGRSAAIAQPSAAPQGLLLHAAEDQAADLAFTARFGRSDGLAHERRGIGVELPVVRDRDFSTRTLHFASATLVAIRPLRTSLRIYGVDAIAGTAVRVELRRPDEMNRVLADRVVLLDVPQQPPHADAPVFPAFAQLHLQQEFTPERLCFVCTVSVVPLPADGSVRPRIWAFLSTTDPESREVAVQRPQ